MRNLVIEGKYVRLEEIAPKHFEYIIKWRNNPELNKFLNQPFELTMELQQKWYERYLKDFSQGLMVLVDKTNNVPFGTMGWTDYNPDEKICISGRVLVGDENYRGGRELTEAVIVFSDFLYDHLSLKNMYGFVADDNKKIISWNKRLGFKKNTDLLRFPNEKCVNGISQSEYIRSKEEYLKIREKIIKLLDY